MEIRYSKFHRWYKPVIENPTELFGTKIQKRVLSSLARIDQTDTISYTIEPLDEDYINWFTPLYEAMLSEKDRAVVYDVYASTIGNEDSKSEYWGLTLFEGDQRIGGTIFGVREEKIMTVYKTYNYSWNQETLQAGPTIMAEYYLCKYAFEIGKNQISHGKDRNPYGVNAAIGLATFKLSLGYRANILASSEDYVVETANTDSFKQDTLILNFPKDGQEITKATLVTTNETKNKYAQLLSYSELLAIDVVGLD